MPQYRHIIFDLGGVLVELGKTPIPEEFFPPEKTITVKDWASLPVAHQFERGEVGAFEFAEKIIDDFDLRLSAHDFIRHFSAWPKRAYPGTKEMLAQLGATCHLSILSNCNEIHWPKMKRDFGIFEFFENTFSSHLIGITKPDIAIFHYVLAQLQVCPGDILYFDDNEKNIAAATTVGINAVHVKGIEAVKEYLKSIQVI